MTREQWLLDALDIFRPWFAEVEKPLPEQIRVSVGYGKGARKSTIGVCYNSMASVDGIHQVFISPELSDPVRILDVLLHEGVHAADDGVSGHTGEFRRVAQALGLEGKMTATVASEGLREKLTTVADKLGEFPHGQLNPARKINTQKTYMLKVICEDAECGWFFRITKKHAERGLPFCICGSDMDFG